MGEQTPIATGIIIACILTAVFSFGNAPLEDNNPTTTEKQMIPTMATSDIGSEFIPGDGESFIQTMTVTTVEYQLTPEERELIERVVMGEAGEENGKSQIAVAQCILNTCIITGSRPPTVIEDFRYTLTRPEPSEQVKESVSSVFDSGEKVIAETIMFFYVPEREASPWHETQKHVCTIEGRRFFERNN